MLHDTQPNLEELELELCRLPEVSSARAVTDSSGRPTEIHVLARPGKPAKQIARDVVSVAHASFGIDLDRRIVSVVQLGTAGETDVDDDIEVVEFRPRILSVATESAGMRAVVRVTLESDGTEAVGFAEGSIASATRHRLVALAALDALRQLGPSAESLDIETAQVVRVGTYDVAVVAVVFIKPPGEQIVSGSAVVRDAKPEDAIARAVLDATNRRLPHLA
jgi:hypothetical protein